MEVAADALLKSDLLGLSLKPSISRVNLEGKTPSNGRRNTTLASDKPAHKYINASRDGFVS